MKTMSGLLVRHRLIFALSVLWLLLGTVSGAQQSTSTRDLEIARKANQEAQTKYYQKQVEEKSFADKISDNPTAVAAALAALITLISFFFNYRATLKNQIDTQFYEALKRFGDRDSPTLRVSAAGLLSQMGRIRSWAVRPRSPFFVQRPYLLTSFYQLLNGYRLEGDRVASGAICDALSALAIGFEGRFQTALLDWNGALRGDLVRALAEFLEIRSPEGGRPLDSPDHADPALWEQAAVVTLLDETVLRAIVNAYKEEFSQAARAFEIHQRALSARTRERLLSTSVVKLSESGGRFRLSMAPCIKVLGSPIKHRLLLDIPLRLCRPSPSFGFKRIHLSLFLTKGGTERQSIAKAFFQNGSLRELLFFRSVLYKVRFEQMDLGAVNFYGCKFGLVKFESTALSGASWLYCFLRCVWLDKGSLEGATFNDTVLQNVTFIEANLKAARFFKCRLVDVGFKRASLVGATMSSAATRVSFVDADLSDADLHGMKCRQVDFSGAKLDGAKLASAKIDEASARSMGGWWKADFSFGTTELVDKEILGILFRESGSSVPRNPEELHPSVRKFLQEEPASSGQQRAV